MAEILTMSHSRRRTGIGPEPVARTIDLFAKSGPSRTVGYVERELPPGGIPAYLAARGNGAQGELLCVVVREKAFRKGLRTRWTVSRPGESDVVGYKGRIVWREAGRARLEFKAFGQAVHLHEPGLDERSAAALLALVRPSTTG